MPARRSYEEDFLLRPNAVDAALLFGLEKLKDGHLRLGLTLVEWALKVDPYDSVVTENYGVGLLNAGKVADALVQLRKSMALRCDRPSVYVHLGSALQRVGESRDAARAYERALTHGVSRADVINALGSLIDDQIEGDRARRCFMTALSLSPEYAKALTNYSLACKKNYGMREALVWAERATNSAPDSAELAYNKACLMQEARLLNHAHAEYGRAIELSSDHAEAHFNRATLSLLLGDYPSGWAEYEWRWKTRVSRNPGAVLDDASLSRLRENLKGSTLLLSHEQGLGDTIQFCRYGAIAARAGARVVMLVPRTLARLLSRQEWVSQVIVIGESVPTVDFHLPMMSLPRVFNTTVKTIPFGDAPYLSPSASDAATFAGLLGETTGDTSLIKPRLRVGLVWNGGFRPDRPELWETNRRRNVPLEVLAEALDLPGIEFVSLQKGDPAESELRGREREYWRRGRMLNLVDRIVDFADTAALIANLDLVISVDTSTAHVAAAMGKPTWILNRFETCWRWFLDRNDSPWYPAVRLYRQEADRDWRPVLKRVAADLVHLSAHKARSRSVDIMASYR